MSKSEKRSESLGGAASFGWVGTAAAILSIALVIVFSAWYASSGRFPKFPKIQNDYVELGKAFLHGQLSLLDRPDPRLAELGNPYEYSQRKRIPYHWDASYYGGKYYLYWGPVPALISAALQAASGGPPPASLLVLIPYLGLLGVSAALLFYIARWFGSAGRSTIWIFILLAFLGLPMLITLGQPRHYQSSILFGQFFLLAGVLAFLMHARHHRMVWLLLCGLSLGLAFASRYNLAISLAIYTLAAAYWLWRDRAVTAFWIRLGLLLVGLAAVLVGQGLYNAARFHNPFETGLTYQLTIPEFRQISYSIAYIPSSLYAYLAYPLTGSGAFPFIQGAHFSAALIPDWIFVPDGREFDQVAFGLLPSVPALWLFALAIPLIASRRRVGAVPTSEQQPSGVSPDQLFAVLSAGVLGQFTFLLVFFYVAERYIVDFYVPLIICLAIVVWSADRALQGHRAWRIALWALVLSLMVWTIATGYFGCFGVPVLVSIYYRPQMVARTAAFWNGLHAMLGAIPPFH